MNLICQNNYLVLLGAEQFLREKAVVAALQAFQGKIITIVKENCINRNRYFHYSLKGDPMNADITAQILHSFLIQNPGKIVGIVPCNDWTLSCASKVSKIFSLPYLDLNVVKMCRDKFEMKKEFAKHDLPVPRFAIFHSFEELKIIANHIGFPMVIKPKDFGGSGGVIKVENSVELLESFQHCEAILNQYASSFYVSSGEYLAEEYILAKDEISVEIFAQGNEQVVLAVTDKYLSAEPWFSEIGHVVPSIYSNDKKIHEIACTAVSVLGINRGVCHVEMRVTKDHRVVLMEVGARPGGDGIMDLVEKTYDINPYHYHIAGWMGKEMKNLDSIPKKPNGTSAIAFLKAPVGKIKQIKVPQRLPEALDALYISAKAGDVSENAICWRAREGIAEFYWKESFDYKINDHLTYSETLSKEIFIME